MPGTALSGKHGTVILVSTGNTELEIGHWTFSSKADIFKYASSKSGGVKLGIAGNSDSSGTIDGKRMIDAPIEDLIQEGDAVTLRLRFSETTYIQVPALIENLDFDVNPDTGDIETFSFGWTSNGGWAFVN